MIPNDFVGVDVSKNKFDIAFKVKGHYKNHTFINDHSGHMEFIKWLNSFSNASWVCMESTGSYSTLLADTLVFYGIKTSVINPFQIKQFAKASLTRNKNDLLDAKVIANFGERMLPREYCASPEQQKEVKGLTNLLAILKTQKIQLTNQLGNTNAKLAGERLFKLINKLDKEIDELEDEIESLVENHNELKEKHQLLTSIKGVGKLTAFQVIAQMPDVASFNNAKQFAAYIGITPKQNQSGTMVGRTTISKIGNARLRKSLYMAALVAIRHNLTIKSFAERLKNSGKKPKSVICAVMRKLAHIIFGVLKNKTPFEENFTCV